MDTGQASGQGTEDGIKFKQAQTGIHTVADIRNTGLWNIGLPGYIQRLKQDKAWRIGQTVRETATSRDLVPLVTRVKGQPASDIFSIQQDILSLITTGWSHCCHSGKSVALVQNRF